MTGHENGSIIFWSTSKRTQLRTKLLPKTKVVSLCYSHKGDVVYVLCTNRLAALKIRTLEMVEYRYGCSSSGQLLIVNPKSGILAVAGFTGFELLEFSDKGFRSIKRAQEPPLPLGLCVSPDGKMLAVCNHHWEVTVLDFETLEEIVVLQHHHPVSSMAFSPDNRFLACGTWIEERLVALPLHFWSVGDWKDTKYLWGHSGAIACMAFSSDSKWLATGSYDGKLRIISVPK